MGGGKPRFTSFLSKTQTVFVLVAAPPVPSSGIQAGLHAEVQAETKRGTIGSSHLENPATVPQLPLGHCETFRDAGW